MKKIIFFFFAYVCLLSFSVGQTTRSIYTDNSGLTPQADGNWGGEITGTEVTTGTPAEGSKHLYYTYNNASPAWSQEALVLNSWNGVDFTGYDKLHISHKGETQTITVQIRDGSNGSNTVALTLNSSSTYVNEEIPLSSFTGSFNKSSIVYIIFIIDNASAGSFYIDNIYLSQTAGPPQINYQSFFLNETSGNGTVVGTVAATGQSLTYSITAGNSGGQFAINPSTGQLTVAGALNTSEPYYALTVQVSDGSQSSSALVTINTVDLFKGNNNLLAPYNGTGTNTITEVTTGSPYEGPSHFELTFPASSYEFNGLEINAGSGWDLSSMTHLVIAYKGSSNPVTDSLTFYLRGGGVNGPSMNLAINTPAYIIDTIPLSELATGSSIDLSNVTDIRINLSNVSSGQFFIDNVHAIYIPSGSTTGTVSAIRGEILSVFPNPSQGEFNINSSLNLSGYNITAADVLGEVVYQGVYSEHMILSHLPAGVYSLKLNNGKECIVKQIIIQ